MSDETEKKVQLIAVNLVALPPKEGDTETRYAEPDQLFEVSEELAEILKANGSAREYEPPKQPVNAEGESGKTETPDTGDGDNSDKSDESDKDESGKAETASTPNRGGRKR